MDDAANGPGVDSSAAWRIHPFHTVGHFDAVADLIDNCVSIPNAGGNDSGFELAYVFDGTPLGISKTLWFRALGWCTWPAD